MKKVIKIIITSLLVSLLLTYFIFYIIYPVETKQFTDDAWNKLNTPLPIVGITVGSILFFVWQVVIKNRFGVDRINSLENKYDKKINDIKCEKEELEKEREKNKKEIENFEKEVKTILVDVCNASPNLTINSIGEKLEGELNGKEKN